MRRADHSAIFVGIAGTTTAVAGLALTGWAQVLVLAMVWGGAVAGIALRQVWLDAPQWVVAIPYVVVGWCPMVVAPQLVRSLGWAGFVLMLAAGLAYTAGALVYARKRPDPWPRVFGFHEVFHLVHTGGSGAVRLRGRLHRPAAVLTASGSDAPFVGHGILQEMPSPSISMALPRMIRYTSSSQRSRTIRSATARVSGQVESVWG